MDMSDSTDLDQTEKTQSAVTAQDQKEREEIIAAAKRAKKEAEKLQEKKSLLDRERAKWEQERNKQSFFQKLFKRGKNRIREVGWGELPIENRYYYRITNEGKEALSLKINGAAILSVPPATSKSTKAEIHLGAFLRNFQDQLNKYNQANSISFEPLGIEPDTNYRIANRTARRIGIENIDKRLDSTWPDLVVPPFGIRVVNSEILKWYRFVTWRDQDLIRVEPDRQTTRLPELWDAFWGWIKLLPGLLLVALVGFGIPLWVVYQFGGGTALITGITTGTLMGLGRLFQVGFICIASILPALFYYLFGRQHVDKLRQRFFRDILVLDPHLYTLSEAETKYDTLLSSAYGSSSSSSPFAILLLMFSTAILVIGWTLTIAPYASFPENPKSLVDFFVIKGSSFVLGFLGMYFFAINMVFRRYVRADLTPKTYANITVRMLVTFVLVWSIDALPEFSNDTLLYPLAFIIGVFPEEGLRLIRDLARNAIKQITANRRKDGGKNNDEKYPLTDLEGLNHYDQARLLEEGIENIENLAHHDLVELLAYTRIPTPRLVDLFDQAILYLHLGIFDDAADVHQSQSTNLEEVDAATSNDKELDGSEIKNRVPRSGMGLLKYLKSFGVRTATDFNKLIDVLQFDPYIMAEIGDKSLLARLHSIYETLSDDEWLSYIRNWRIESSEAARIKVGLVTVPYEIYKVQPAQTGGMRQKVADAAAYLRSTDRGLADSLLKAVKAYEFDDAKKLISSQENEKNSLPDVEKTVKPVASTPPQTEMDKDAGANAGQG
jgi:hypothetical protein